MTPFSEWKSTSRSGSTKVLTSMGMPKPRFTTIPVSRVFGGSGRHGKLVEPGSIVGGGHRSSITGATLGVSGSQGGSQHGVLQVVARSSGRRTTRCT